MSDGFVQGLWRFPVLGMKGEQLRSSQVDTRGIAGDRQHFATGPEGMLTPQDIPRLGEWTAAFPFNPDGAIVPLKKLASILTVLSMAALGLGVDLRIIGEVGGRVTAAVSDAGA